jgi:hypothetical protein
MKRIAALFLIIAVVAAAPVIFTGCESTDTSVSTGVYYGTSYYDPWYYGEYWDDPDLIVTPPEKPSSPPPEPAHPIALPPSSSMPRPTPMPSIPSTPRPSFRR